MVKKIPVRKKAIHFTDQINQLLNGPINNISYVAAQSVKNTDMNIDIHVSNSLSSLLHASYNHNINYPHQCWEQELSRAVAQAVKLKLSTETNAKEQLTQLAEIDKILQQSVNHQATNGGMTFFSGQVKHVNEFLTFHTVQVFQFLRELGHLPPEQVTNRLQLFIEDYINEFEQNHNKPPSEQSYKDYKHTLDLYLMALASRENQPSSSGRVLKDIVSQPEQLSLNQVNHLMKVQQSEISVEHLVKLLNQHYADQGDRKVLKKPFKSEWHTLDSEVSLQCSSIHSMLNHSKYNAQAGKLYPHVLNLTSTLLAAESFGNTFDNSTCLMAFQRFINQFERERKNQLISDVSIRVNDQLLPSGTQVNLSYTTPEPLNISISNPSKQTLYMSANMEYWREPEINISNNGLDLERSYFKLVDGQWESAEPDSLVVGDWVVIRLTVSNPIPRKFIAVSSPNPGGWMPTDINLNSVAPAGMRNNELSLQDSYFYERQLNPVTSLFYADFLPAGRHRIHYAGQVKTAGTFTALPAQVEAMYQPDIRAATRTESWQIKE